MTGLNSASSMPQSYNFLIQEQIFLFLENYIIKAIILYLLDLSFHGIFWCLSDHRNHPAGPSSAAFFSGRCDQYA